MAELLKNQFFQKDFLESLGQAIEEVASSPTREEFLKKVYDEQWDKRELKQRMSHISKSINQVLKMDYERSLVGLRRIANRFSGFDGMVFPDFVEQFGLDHPISSFEALEQFTSYSSSEFAIRPFIVRYPIEALNSLLKWSVSANNHVRRLASEGCRPRLPWATALQQFKQDPTPIFPILENLKSDPSDYVRKSVANNLNDVTKDNPGLAMNLIDVWNKKPTTETDWIIKHGLRSLVKAGDQRALGILGFGVTKVQVSKFKLDPDRLHLGQNLSLQFDLASPVSTKQSLMIDYLIHFVKANGKRAPKVFKLTQLDIGPNQTISLTKSHPIKKITTRKYYQGLNLVEIQINGEIKARAEFKLMI